MSANIEGYAVAAGEGLLSTTVTIWLKTLPAFCVSIYQTSVEAPYRASYAGSNINCLMKGRFPDAS